MIFPLLQVDIFEPTAVEAPFDYASLLINPIVVLIAVFLGFAAILAFAVFAIRRAYNRSGSARSAFNMQVLLVRVPKEVKKEDEQNKSQQQIQELIGVMETLFATLGAFKAESGIFTWLFGRSDHFAFEMVVHHDKISFYVTIPQEYRNFIEEQLHAQYPHAQIDEVPDYNIFTPSGVVMGSYLKFRREDAFPIKTYDKLESDPLNSITNALSKITGEDGAAVQYIIRSAKSKWRKQGIHMAKEMQQGKKLKDVKSGIASSVGKELKSFASTAKPGEEKTKEIYRLSPLEEEMVKGLEEKASLAGLDVNVRIIVSASDQTKAQRYLNDILGAYGQYNIYEYGNSFVKSMPRFQTILVRHFIYRHFDTRYSIVLNSKEMASLYHMPLPTTETPKINWLLSRRALPPTNLPTEGVILGKSEYRGHEYLIRMKPDDRRRHFYIIGKSGSGKTALMESMIRQDIMEGRGVCLIDPHGDFIDKCLTHVPRERAEDVILFDPSDHERPIGLNMLEFDPGSPHLRTFVINEMLKIFDKLYDLKATGGPMFETYMRNAILLNMDHPESGNTLMDVPRVLADEDFRNFKLSKCKSQEVKNFWTKEALKAGGEASLANMVPYITSKLASFIYNDYMRPIIGQQKSAFNFYDAMNEGKIILVKLSKGKIGDLNAYLLGMIIVGKILDASLKRAEIPEAERKDFYLYIDEFQNFLTDSISAILSEARKYGLNLIIAHQFIGQLTTGAIKDTAIRDAIFGNVGTMAAFRIGPEDAEFLVKEFAPVFNEYDLVNVESLTANIKLLIDNTASRPFNMKVIFAPRPGPAEKELAGMIRELSRFKYGRKRELIEAEMQESAAGVDMFTEEANDE
ncbi:type IV secretion system DNA-binding domain-containing protein [Patescibacteria group bacterium]|nr:type IV secretion system DNA-binding domain-containing protein [Patescibacteria group bacterium]MBU1629748.1 type IV secretion system DNA-binding domain-containing protein [Patescibacteria group bacterium]MBU1907971.1 type IV secretion system DNA-binding domain-containing protein [Patescibacteria group bacterium]